MCKAGDAAGRSWLSFIQPLSLNGSKFCDFRNFGVHSGIRPSCAAAAFSLPAAIIMDERIVMFSLRFSPLAPQLLPQ
jgi:hypothetical protein